MSNKKDKWMRSAFEEASDKYADHRMDLWRESKRIARHEALMGFIAGVEYVLYHRPLPRNLRRKAPEGWDESEFIQNLP